MSDLKYIGKNILNHDLILKKGNVSGSNASTGSFGHLIISDLDRGHEGVREEPVGAAHPLHLLVLRLGDPPVLGEFAQELEVLLRPEPFDVACPVRPRFWRNQRLSYLNCKIASP